MEVGAVKQAFNNEIILLKKKLNQAKTHAIHKLTRKAKTLTEKKAPEHLKEKLKRKAEAAVNEVLLIKKIKARDIAKFMITHTGKLEDYINRPKVDNDKACARLVLNKSLQDKYKFIRNRFGNVPIKDLFMSRQERRKIKKDARDAQKNKKKGKKGNVVNAQGDWNVEDMELGDESKDVTLEENVSDEEGSSFDIGHSKKESDEESGDENDSEVDDQGCIDHSVEVEDNQENSETDNDEDVEKVSENSNSDDEAIDDYDNSVVGENDDDGNDDKEAKVGMFVKLTPEKEITKPIGKLKPPKNNIKRIETSDIDAFTQKVKGKKQIDKKVKENKNKNLKEKLQNRKFKKDEDDTQLEGRKVVDPFFITATGEKYLSLAEPRQPDEVKEVHKQGNRQERRAAMFGHVLKHKPRRDDFRQNNFRSNKFDQHDNNNGPAGFKNKDDRFNNGSNFNDNNSKFNNRNDKFNDRNSNFNDRSNKFNDRNSKCNDRNVNNFELKEEKLHPSWEAKRKLKSAMSLLPAKGKKIVFD